MLVYQRVDDFSIFRCRKTIDSKEMDIFFVAGNVTYPNKMAPVSKLNHDQLVVGRDIFRSAPSQ